MNITIKIIFENDTKDKNRKILELKEQNKLGKDLIKDKFKDP